MVARKFPAALKPGGIFVNADQALAPSLQGEEQYEEHWLAEVRANGIGEEELARAQIRKEEDRSALLLDQLTWLEEVGFDRVDCWYKRFRFVVYGGYKNYGE